MLRVRTGEVCISDDDINVPFRIGFPKDFDRRRGSTKRLPIDQNTGADATVKLLTVESPATGALSFTMSNSFCICPMARLNPKGSSGRDYERPSIAFASHLRSDARTELLAAPGVQGVSGENASAMSPMSMVRIGSIGTKDLKGTSSCND